MRATVVAAPAPRSSVSVGSSSSTGALPPGGAYVTTVTAGRRSRQSMPASARARLATVRQDARGAVCVCVGRRGGGMWNLSTPLSLTTHKATYQSEGQRQRQRQRRRTEQRTSSAPKPRRMQTQGEEWLPRPTQLPLAEASPKPTMCHHGAPKVHSMTLPPGTVQATSQRPS